VNYEYAISKTELSAGQYYEYVEAIKSFWQGDLRELNGSYVRYTGTGQAFGVRSNAVNNNYPAGVNLWNAARYANWLHNGKVNEAWAFQSGAYEVPQLGNDPEYYPNGALERSPDAKYWIPSEDEWVKAVYWDPSKDGVGGYWPYPNGTDVPLVPGLPGEGDTPVGLGLDVNIPIGSYPDTMTPWGLLDASGGWLEMTDTAESGLAARTWGSSNASPSDGDSLTINSMGHRRLTTEGAGLRLATNVPTPGSLVTLGCAVVFAARRKR
jgi:hypothetical protein